MRTAKSSEEVVTLGAWEPNDGCDICDIAVVAKENVEYLQLLLDESGRQLHATVVVSPNWSNKLDLIAFCVRGKFFCNAHLISRDLVISQIAEEWAAWRDFHDPLGYRTLTVFEHLAQFRGNRVEQFRKLSEKFQGVVYKRLLLGEGLGSPWPRDRFQCSAVSLVPLRAAFGELQELVDAVSGESLKGSGITELCAAMENVLGRLHNSQDQIATRVAYSAILCAGGKYWMRVKSFQLAFLYFHRAMDALLQAIALDLELVGLDDDGILFGFTRAREKRKFSVGFGAHLILECGRLVQAREVFQQVLNMNAKRNWCLIGHGTGGVSEQTAEEAEKALIALSGFLPEGHHTFWSTYAKKLSFDISLPHSLPYNLIDDIDSGIRIRRLK